MNLFELMTLNNYGRTKEVLFTSALSYFLNPDSDHGLGGIFLKKLLDQLKIKEPKGLTIDSEKNLGKDNLGKDIGKIDIYIEDENNIVGIEAKIWDDSAINNSKNNEEQLVRYCTGLENIALAKKNINWTLIFLIPYESAPTCIEEFEKIKKLHPKNVKLLTWAKIPSTVIKDDYLQESIQDMLESIITNNIFDIQNRTAWILKSMYEYIPKFVKEEKSQNRFPSRDELTKRPDVWKLIEPFIFNSGARIDSRHTTIGFPYGTPPAKSEYGNTLYRIRTTKDYYPTIADKEINYPENLEIEIWPEVYDLIKGDKEWKTLLTDWDNGDTLPKDFHINGKDDEEIVLLSIPTTTKIDAKDVTTFNKIMRKGFKGLN
jgi:hypothetical protein